MPLKFFIKMKHFVQNIATGQKAKVWYSRGQVCKGPAGEVGLFDCITIYSKEYGYELNRVMERVGKTENDTDSMTDYFDKSRFRVFPDNPMFSRVSQFSK